MTHFHHLSSASRSFPQSFAGLPLTPILVALLQEPYGDMHKPTDAHMQTLASRAEEPNY